MHGITPLHDVRSGRRHRRWEDDCGGAGSEVGRLHAWNPARGPGVAAQQRPPPPAVVRSDGSVDRKLWTPSEGPCRNEVGGAGGEPDGRSMPIRKVCWD
jgi:hypothetical protein